MGPAYRASASFLQSMFNVRLHAHQLCAISSVVMNTLILADGTLLESPCLFGGAEAGEVLL